MTRNEILRARNQAMEPKTEATKREETKKETNTSTYLEMKNYFTGDNDDDISLEEGER